ncbi:unnamed protein product, partial [Ilex paraguariensis]
ATSSALPIPAEAASIPVSSIDLTLDTDRTPTPADLLVTFDASIPSTASLPTIPETKAPIPDPPINPKIVIPFFIEIIVLQVASLPRPIDVDPEEKTTKMRQLESPDRSQNLFRPILRAKGREISIRDSATEDMNVVVGIARSVILP